MSCVHAHSDAPYVLGALSPSERTAYEQHLDGCAVCRAAVADIAVLPGLLARLDLGTAEKILRPGPAAAQPRAVRWPTQELHGDLARLRDDALRGGPAPDPRQALRPPGPRIRPPRRLGAARRWLGYAAGGLAAAGLALVVGLAAWPSLRPPPSQVAAPPAPTARSGATSAPALVAMVPVSQDIPLEAEIGLTRRGYGTAVRMVCAYTSGGPDSPTWTVSLLAYGPGESREQLGSWVAEPGGKVDFDGVTRFSGDQLRRLEIVRADTGERLVTYRVPT